MRQPWPRRRGAACRRSVSPTAPTGVPPTFASTGGTRFRVSRGGQDLGEFTMPLLGEHNVRNALAAIAVGADLGLDLEKLRTGLAEFTGVKRRLEVVGEANGVTVYDDFAHHPTAVEETLRAIRQRRSGTAGLGHLRAALGVVVPARVPGRLRARVRRRRPGGARVGLPIEPAARRASVGKPAGRRSGASSSVPARHLPTSTRLSTPWPARPATAI